MFTEIPITEANQNFLLFDSRVPLILFENDGLIVIEASHFVQRLIIELVVNVGTVRRNDYPLLNMVSFSLKA